MYRMLLIDDENFVLEGMRSAINWKQLGIEIVGCFYNGKEALRFLADHTCDIIVTDIMMPEMNGIELIQKLDNMRMDIKVVLLTAYSDFEYAKQAIRYQVFDYLLKPVTVASIRDVFTRLVQQCDQERRDHERQQALSDNLSKLTEKSYADVLRGITAELPATIQHQTHMIRYRICAVRADEKDSATDIGALYDFLTNLPCANQYVVVCMDESRLALVLQWRQYDRQTDCLSLMRGVQRAAQDSFSSTVSIGVGRACKNLTDIHVSWEEARHALEKKMIVGNGALVEYLPPTNSPPPGKQLSWLPSKMHSVMRSVDCSNASMLKEAFLGIRGNMEGNAAYEIEDLHYVYTELVLLLQKAGKNNQLQSEEFTAYCAQLMRDWEKEEDIREVFDHLENGFHLLLGNGSAGGTAHVKNQRLVKQIVAYIDENINQTVSLKQFAEKVSLTSNYVGFIFKQSTGISFNEYVSKTRMEHAKKLLSSQRYKVYEVAAMVGYKSTNHFSKLFVAYTGIPPSEYRA